MFSFPHGTDCTCQHCWAETKLLPANCQGCAQTRLRGELETCWPDGGSRSYQICVDCQGKSCADWSELNGSEDDEDAEDAAVLEPAAPTATLPLPTPLRPSSLAERVVTLSSD